MSSGAELLTFDELTDEIEKRFPCYLLVTHREAEGDSKEEARIKFSGSPYMALGLMVRANTRLQRAMESAEHEPDPNAG